MRLKKIEIIICENQRETKKKESARNKKENNLRKSAQTIRENQREIKRKNPRETKKKNNPQETRKNKKYTYAWE